MPLEATDHQAKQGSHQTIRHGTAEKQGAASCGQRAAQVDQQWLGGFCRDLGNFPAQLIQRNRIGAAPAAQIVQSFQNGEIRAAGSQDPAGLGDVPPAGQRHGYHDAGGDDKGIHPNSPVGRAHTGKSVLHPVYLCALRPASASAMSMRAVQQRPPAAPGQGSYLRSRHLKAEEHGAVNVSQTVSAAHGHGVRQLCLQLVHIGLHALLERRRRPR